MGAGAAGRRLQERRAGVGYQVAGMALCSVFGIAMVLNNQMGGEAMWFWYATVFHGGAKLYSGLHVALQPLFVLLTNAWMQMFGHRLWVMELPSLLQIVGMCVGLFLLLRESSWADWQKAVVLLGAFTLTVSGHSYRFDDYHILTENLIVYALLVLFWMERARSRGRVLALAAGLGCIAGLAVTTRVTDGVALVGAAVVCLPLVLRRYRVASLALFLAVAALTVLAVVRCTGDSFSAYLSSTVFRAAASKGGTRSILAAPLAVFPTIWPVMSAVGRRVWIGVLLLLATGPLLARYRPRLVRHLFGIQMGLAVAALVLTTHFERNKLLNGAVIHVSMLTMIPIFFVVVGWVAARVAKGDLFRADFDRRQVLVILPFAEWASYSAGAAAEPLTNYYAPFALLLLFVPILQPWRQWREWAYPTFLTFMALLAASSLVSKWIIPYSWQNYRMPPFFRDRAWIDHRTYGPMYVDRELLQFSRRVCADIGAEAGRPRPELLSLPYPFPNYFCDTPPWHNYVQTFFDTSTRGTIEQMMRELEARPPEWIVYQRQLNILGGAERLYNHGQPLAQRDLDHMIERKLGAGEWVLVDESQYLNPDHKAGEGWYIVRTHR